MCRVQELRLYLKGQGHTNILNFHIVTLELIGTHNRVRAVTLSCMEGFYNYLA
jgi:hypothetical protein